MTHPLTQELMDNIHGDEPGYSNPYDEDDMRAAYDLGREEQLEQCIAWFDDTDCLAQRMRKAMRPAQEDL